MDPTLAEEEGDALRLFHYRNCEETSFFRVRASFGGLQEWGGSCSVSKLCVLLAVDVKETLANQGWFINHFFEGFGKEGKVRRKTCLVCLLARTSCTWW